MIKREADAEADPQWFGAGYPFNYPRAVVAPTAVAAPVVAPTVATVKHVSLILMPTHIGGVIKVSVDFIFAGVPRGDN